ncbi:MAG: Arm DNA-binding domain-containing protein, partial [Burkholderiaceae bacterium]|nr:Arm DNA-binding domain-containing protein [Burkholderiaceae bacterium]
MTLTDTFVKQVKHSGRPSGDKYADGGGLYLLVKAAGKYWRMGYRFAGKEKLLSFGVYPALSLAKARQRRDKAREQLAGGIDPSAAKREEKQARAMAAANTFELVAREFHKVKSPGWSEKYARNWLTGMESYLFPSVGKRPVASITPGMLLDVLRLVEKRGIL